MGVPVHVFIPINNLYGYIVRRTTYEIRKPEYPHLSNTLLQTTTTTSQLYRILSRHKPTVYVYIYIYVYVYVIGIFAAVTIATVNVAAPQTCP